MILVTGGAGYIGSHTCIELSKAGYDFVIVDNLSNSLPGSVDRIKTLTGKDVNFFSFDLRNQIKLEQVFECFGIDMVIHFAGFKAVGESVKAPLDYYKNNIECTISLCEVMTTYNVKKLVFSSSAAVYRSDNLMPVDENSALGCTSPYGWTKFMIEQMLRDLSIADDQWSIVLLRYFNPVGAHESGIIGEENDEVPKNLMPYITQVASKRLEKLYVYGKDYPTKDGTGIRDYIHVVDLAVGHLSALNYIKNHNGIEAINLGTGKGYSVLELLSAFEKTTGMKVPFELVGRRAGDIPVCYACPQKAKELLNWQAELGIEDMCRDAWRFEELRGNRSRF